MVSFVLGVNVWSLKKMFKAATFCMRTILTFICANAGVILTIQSEQSVLMKSDSPVLVVPDYDVLTESEGGVLVKSDSPVLITPEYSI